MERQISVRRLLRVPVPVFFESFGNIREDVLLVELPLLLSLLLSLALLWLLGMWVGGWGGECLLYPFCCSRFLDYGSHVGDDEAIHVEQVLWTGVVCFEEEKSSGMKERGEEGGILLREIQLS